MTAIVPGHILSQERQSSRHFPTFATNPIITNINLFTTKMKINIITKLFLFFGCFMTATPIFSQPAEKLLKITVTPDHEDWLYRAGEKATATICVWHNQVPLKNAVIRYEISEDLMKPHIVQECVLKDGTLKLSLGTLQKPGFLRCRVIVNYGNHQYEDAATIGFSPEKLLPTTQRPKDFKEFWERELNKVSMQPLEPRMTLLPDKCTSGVNVYHISFRNNWVGSRIYGILCMPKDSTKKYPAILKLPGAGVRAYQGEISLAGKGVITLEIGIHGMPVNLPTEAYTIGGGPLLNYHDRGLDNKDDYYYKRVYLGCKRAVDFIFSLPEVDGHNIIAFGGSQGGALSLVTTALDTRIQGAVCFYPALCDMEGYLHGRAGGWPHMFKKPQYCNNKAVETIRYYDVANFVSDIKVPIFMSFGYNDTTCPPTTSYSIMNTMTCPITTFITPDSYHFMYPEQREAAVNWALKLLRK